MYSVKCLFAAVSATFILSAGAVCADILASEERRARDGYRGSLDQGGDNAATAITVPGLPFCDTGTTSGYTNDYAPACLPGLNGPDVVYRYAPATTADVVFSFCGSGYDNVCHVWNIVPGPGAVPFLCAHDNCGNSACASFTAVAGTTYYIVLDGQYGASGEYRLNASAGSTCPSTPCTAINDSCEDAVLLSTNGLYAGTTAGATLDNAPYCVPHGQPSGPGVWYRVVGQGRNVTMSIQTAGFPARLGIYCGTCPCLSCYDQTNDCSTDSMTVCLTSGTTYYLLVSSCDGSTGPFTLALSQQSSPCLPGISCLAAVETPLTAPGSRSGNTCGGCNDCALRASSEVVIPVQIPYAGRWAFSLCQSSFNTYMYIGTMPCSANIYANDDSCGVQSASPCLDLIARPYYVTIEGNVATACGDYVLEVFPCLPPTNDDCADAIEISYPGTYTGTTWEATADTFPPGSLCDPVTGPGVWYKFSGHNRVIGVEMTSYLMHRLTYFYESCCGRLYCIYQGACGAPQSIGICPGACTHYLLISSCTAAGGPFTFTTDEGAACEDATCGIVDHTLFAPGEVSDSSCGKCDDCGLRPGQDVNARLNIGTTGSYIISVEAGFPAMLYIGSVVCSQTVYASPDCGMFLTSGALNLSAGSYWITLEPCEASQCGRYTISAAIAPPPPGGLVIEFMAPASVRLNWVSSPAPVSGYKIYRALTPDVPAIPENFVALTPDTFYVDAIGDPARKHFYAVTVVTP